MAENSSAQIHLLFRVSETHTTRQKKTFVVSTTIKNDKISSTVYTHFVRAAAVSRVRCGAAILCARVACVLSFVVCTTWVWAPQKHTTNAFVVSRVFVVTTVGLLLCYMYVHM